MCIYYKKGIIIKNFFMCSLNIKEKNWLFDDFFFLNIIEVKFYLIIIYLKKGFLFCFE